VIGVPVTTWYTCSRCAHGVRHGTLCGHPTARRDAGGVNVPVDRIRCARELCGPDGNWHEYAYPLAAAA